MQQSLERAAVFIHAGANTSVALPLQDKISNYIGLKQSNENNRKHNLPSLIYVCFQLAGSESDCEPGERWVCLSCFLRTASQGWAGGCGCSHTGLSGTVCLAFLLKGEWEAVSCLLLWVFGRNTGSGYWCGKANQLHAALCVICICSHPNRETSDQVPSMEENFSIM